MEKIEFVKKLDSLGTKAILLLALYLSSAYFNGVIERKDKLIQERTDMLIKYQKEDMTKLVESNIRVAKSIENLDQKLQMILETKIKGGG